jgi:DNA-binding IclR family transcriptional regulator
MTSLQNSTNLSKITIFERFWPLDSLELTQLNGAGSWELGAGSWELGAGSWGRIKYLRVTFKL